VCVCTFCVVLIFRDVVQQIPFVDNWLCHAKCQNYNVMTVIMKQTFWYRSCTMTHRNVKTPKQHIINNVSEYVFCSSIILSIFVFTLFILI